MSLNVAKESPESFSASGRALLCVEITSVSTSSGAGFADVSIKSLFISASILIQLRVTPAGVIRYSDAERGFFFEKNTDPCNAFSVENSKIGSRLVHNKFLRGSALYWLR